MKLAEALILRADRKRRIDQLKLRIIRNAKIQEGMKPSEEPQALIDELVQTATEFGDLIRRINRTNTVTEFEENVSLADALATRDILQLQFAAFRDMANAATIVQDIRTKSEVRYMTTLNVAQLQQRADNLAKAHRELDTKIQELNWLTELVE